MPGFIEPQQWKTFLDDFTKRNQFRATRLESIGETGAQEEARYLPLVGISYEPKGSDAGDVIIILGAQAGQDTRQFEHVVPAVERIAPLIGDTGEEGVGFEDRDGGKTLLVFEDVREIPAKTSAAP